MHKQLIEFRSGLGERSRRDPLIFRRLCRTLNADSGASLVEYSLAVLFIGLAAIVATSFVGRATSDAFDEVANAFPPVAAAAAAPADPVISADFDGLVDLVTKIGVAGQSLINKATAARDGYAAGDFDEARKQLDSLVKQVDALPSSHLSDQDADAIRDAVQGLVDAIEPG